MHVLAMAQKIPLATCALRFTVGYSRYVLCLPAVGMALREGMYTLRLTLHALR